jgi:SEC-C motif domain protein
MRSRYAAYVLKLEDYLLKTWHPDTRPQTLNLTEDPTIQWLGLQVKHAENTDNNSATVEFVARYKVTGKAEKIHEVSKFLRIENYWYYLSGVHID